MLTLAEHITHPAAPRRPEQAIADRLTTHAATLPFVGHLHDLCAADPLRGITAVQELRAVLDDAEALAVVAARNARHGWRQIAAVLLTDHRTAWRRYRWLDPRDGGRGRVSRSYVTGASAARDSLAAPPAGG